MTLGLSAAVTAALDRVESMAVEWVAEATRRRPKGLESADGGENGRETA